MSIGIVSEIMITAALMKYGRQVLKPINPESRYDLVIEDEDKFLRVQCKTGRLKNGVIVFAVAKMSGKYRTERRNYRGQIDFFGVYCPELDKCFLVPIE